LGPIISRTHVLQRYHDLVRIDLQALRHHYEALSDEELLALDRVELTEAARKYYDAEFARRQLTGAEEIARMAEPEESFATLEESDWLEDAACACSFSAATSPRHSSAEDAAQALAALQAAGIPCQIEVHDIEQLVQEAQTYQEYRVMVPGALNLRAASVLDQELFNDEQEDQWRAHFAELSDEELSALNPEAICAGLRDRIARLTRAYQDEVKKRKGNS